MKTEWEGWVSAVRPAHRSPPAATTDPSPPFLTQGQALPLPWLWFPTCKLCIKGNNGTTTFQAFPPPPKCCLSPSSGQMCQHVQNTPSAACPVGRIREKPRPPLFTPGASAASRGHGASPEAGGRPLTGRPFRPGLPQSADSREPASAHFLGIELQTPRGTQAASRGAGGGVSHYALALLLPFISL